MLVRIGPQVSESFDANGRRSEIIVPDYVIHSVDARILLEKLESTINK